MASPSGVISEVTESPLERRTCDLCAKEEPLTAKPLKVCARCGGRRYCSARCQRLDWPQHKVRCAKRPSAGRNKEPLRTKADRDHDASVREDEQATAMENLLSDKGRSDEYDHLMDFLSHDDTKPQAIKELAVTGLPERVASGELSSYIAGAMCCARLDFLTNEGVEEPVTDAVRVEYIPKFAQNEAKWLREFAAMNAVLDRAMGPMP